MADEVGEGSLAPRRCTRHGLSLDDGGTCVRCRREAAPPPVHGFSGRAIALVLGLFLALGVWAAARKREAKLEAVAANVTPVAPATVAPTPRAPVPPSVIAAPVVPAVASPNPPIVRNVVDSPDLAAPDSIAEAEAYVAAARARRAAEDATTDRQRALADVQVVMYSTSWCGYCKRARAWFAQNGVAYTDHDIEREPEAKARQRALNPGGGVPTFDIDGQVLRGFSPESLGQAIASAAQRRARR